MTTKMAIFNVTEKQQKSHFSFIFFIEIFVTSAKVNIPNKLQS